MLGSRKKPCEPNRDRFIALGLALFILCAIFIAWRKAPQTKPIVDTQTQCPADIAAVAAILVDVTDPLSEDQKVKINRDMAVVFEGVPQYGRVDLFVLDAEQTAQPRFSQCNPGDGSGTSIFFVNPDMAKKKWKQQFLDKLLTELGNAVASEGTTRSPLFEAINSVCARSFSGHAANAPGGRSLYIVSDMMNLTKGLNQYHGKETTNFHSFSAKPYYAATRPTNLASVRVILYYVRRPELGALQGPKHKEFWREFFTACGASVEIKEI